MVISTGSFILRSRTTFHTSKPQESGIPMKIVWYALWCAGSCHSNAICIIHNHRGNSSNAAFVARFYRIRNPIFKIRNTLTIRNNVRYGQSQAKGSQRTKTSIIRLFPVSGGRAEECNQTNGWEAITDGCCQESR